MTVEVRGVTIEDLKAYKEKNPVKFALKFGEIDFNDLPKGFNIALYKGQVARFRSNREAQGLSNDDVVITPWTFAPKAVEVKEESEVGEAEVVETADVEVKKETKAKKTK